MATTSRPTAVWAFLDEWLQDALNKTARINVKEFPVVQEKASYEIIGLNAKWDIISPLPLTSILRLFFTISLWRSIVKKVGRRDIGNR